LSKSEEFESDNSVFELYVKDIKKYPILSSDEISKLIIKAQAGDIQARNRVIESNLRFVISIAKRFQGRGLPLMDLISEGNLGIAYAITKYNPELGIPFIGYASWWVKQYINQAIYWTGREIRLPVSQHLKIITILKCRKTFLQQNGRWPTTTEVSILTDIPDDQIDFLMMHLSKSISVDSYVGDDEENSLVCDIIPDENARPLEELVDDTIKRKEILDAFKLLPIRERDIMSMLYGIGRPQIDSKQIARMYGVGTERIRQIKEASIEKLKLIASNKLSKLL
jgi:RNA polymerase primary sigma factor